MKNLFLAIAFLSVTSVFAQRGKMANLSPSDKTQKFINHWGKELNLSADQQTKAQPGVMDMFTKIGQLRADTGMDQKSKRMAIMNARKSGLDGFKALLTADQAALYDKKMQEMKDKQKARQNNNQQAKQRGPNKAVQKAAQEEIDNDDIF
jgi:hypothetical protein